MSPLVGILAAVAGVLVGALVAFFVVRSREAARRELEKANAQDDASRILKVAREEAENARRSKELEGKEEVLRLREAWKREEAGHREDAERLERRLVERTESLDRKFDAFNERETAQERRSKDLEKREASLVAQTEEVRRLGDEFRRRLESLAGM